jgi:hypothetical protein
VGGLIRLAAAGISTKLGSDNGAARALTGSNRHVSAAESRRQR